jgi:hypothetical protein
LPEQIVIHEGAKAAADLDQHGFARRGRRQFLTLLRHG